MMSSYSRTQRRQSCASCLRFVVIVANLVFAVVGAVVAAVFIYLHITQIDFVSAVLGTLLVPVANGLVIAAGCLLFVLAVFGIIIGCVDKPKAYLVYFILMILPFLVIVTGIISSLVFKTWLSEDVRADMIKTLRNDYGVKLDEEWNKKVTDSWDEAQSLWKCCSVDDRSWYVYHDSKWYEMQEGTPGNKPEVPESCCVRDSKATIRKCQIDPGPPTTQDGAFYSGTPNLAIHSRGCFQAAQDYLINENLSWFSIIIGVGSAVAVLVLLGIFLAIAVYVTRKREVKADSFIAEYSQHSGAVLF